MPKNTVPGARKSTLMCNTQTPQVPDFVRPQASDNHDYRVVQLEMPICMACALYANVAKPACRIDSDLQFGKLNLKTDPFPASELTQIRPLY